MSRVSVIGYRFVSDGAFSEKQRELILADPRVREVRPGPGWRRSFDDINNHGGDEGDDRAGDQGCDPEQGGGSYIDISTLSTQVERILLQQTSRDLLASTALAALPPMQDLVFVGQSVTSLKHWILRF